MLGLFEEVLRNGNGIDFASFEKFEPVQCVFLSFSWLINNRDINFLGVSLNGLVLLT